MNRQTPHRRGTAASRILLACAAVLVSGILLAAEPYLPADDAEVLETLPGNVLSGDDELTRMRRQLSVEPNNINLAQNVASRYVQIGNQEGDPRFYGYARAAISPWWEATSPPPPILKLRAKLKEKDHGYAEALDDLQLLLETEPEDTQAWIDVANIYRVQGDFGQAMQACDQLSTFSNLIYTTLCRTPLLAANGQAQESYTTLTQLLPLAQARSPGAVQWMLTTLAEIAVGLGLDEQAEQHFQAGLTRNPRDYYLMRAYSDFLLDHERPQEALNLLREHTQDNGILLRAAIAARRSGNQSLADDLQTQLENRFREIRLRGSQPHGRFEARYALELKNDPQQALQLALGNWEQQKETRDTRNLLEAAIAAGDSQAVQPALQFLSDSGNENVILNRLAAQLEQPE